MTSHTSITTSPGLNMITTQDYIAHEVCLYMKLFGFTFSIVVLLCRRPLDRTTFWSIPKVWTHIHRSEYRHVFLSRNTQ